ncbi:hypothetical protein HDU79_001195 [Rhizoclosmatium sp. JEL0117]|nr:hypothetical protein HDU79_001195 [Rhizoclosmatium sp. JEL0117]
MAIDWTIIFPAVVGPLMTFQGAAGSKLAALGGGPGFSTFIIFFFAFFPALILWLADTNGGSSPDLALGRANTQWFAYLCGLCGPFVVLCICTIIPVLGASLYFVVSVTVNMTVALILDNYGLIGLPQNTASTGSIVGLSVILFSVIVIGFAPSKVVPPAQELPDSPGVVQAHEHKVDVVKAEEESATSSKVNKGSLFKYSIFLAFAAMAGALGSVQAGLSYSLSVGYGSSSFSVMANSGLAVVPSFLAFLVQHSKQPTDFRKVFREAPWWSWIAAPVNFAFICTVTYLPARLGTAVLVGTMTCTTLLAATIFDHFGLFGLPVQKVSALKAGGIMLLLAGVIVMSIYK